MTMTDPIADMLTRLRNANQAFLDSTSMPSSKIKVGIAEILKANPALEATLNALSGKLSDEVLQGLNAKVDVDKTAIEEVARQLLAESGLN